MRLRYITAACCIFALTGCPMPQSLDATFATHRSPGEKITGYGPIPFNTGREDAFKAAQPYSGQWLDVKGYDKPVLFYKQMMGPYEFDVWQYFDKKTDKTAKVELMSVNAITMAQDKATCRKMWEAFLDSFTKKYGSTDFVPRTHSKGTVEKSTGIFTFSDSSNVKVLYEWDQEARDKPRCQMKITYNPPWAS